MSDSFQKAILNVTHMLHYSMLEVIQKHLFIFSPSGEKDFIRECVNVCKSVAKIATYGWVENVGVTAKRRERTDKTRAKTRSNNSHFRY